MPLALPDLTVTGAEHWAGNGLGFRVGALPAHATNPALVVTGLTLRRGAIA